MTALSGRTKTLTIAGLLAVGSLLGPSVASAQSTDGPITPGEITITPFIGFGFSGDLDSGTGAVGVAGGYNYSSKVSIEGEFNILPSPELNGAIETDATSWSLTGNLLYHFAKKNNFTPYAVVGVGVGHSSVEVLGFEASSSKFVANIGGGVERPFSERLRFRGDLRYLFGGDTVPDYWRLTVGVTFALPR